MKIRQSPSHYTGLLPHLESKQVPYLQLVAFRVAAPRIPDTSEKDVRKYSTLAIQLRSDTICEQSAYRYGYGVKYGKMINVCQKNRRIMELLLLSYDLFRNTSLIYNT